MTLVAGIDSSTQSCKVTVRDLDTGLSVREGAASHPPQTVVDPEVWWEALLEAVAAAGGLDDVAAVSVSGQQHTPIFLDAEGTPTTLSPLWNDLGSHPHMVALNAELGRDTWIRRTGLPLTVSDTVVKARWLRDEHPDAAARTAAIAVVHDWLTWRLRGYGSGAGGIDQLVTDRSEASGTGYWSPETGEYERDLVAHALGHDVVLPTVLGPRATAGRTASGLPGIPAGIPIGVGSGDNAAAALALGLVEGDAVLSLGTSGVVYARTSHPVHDYAGYVCNYADATGDHLPLVATLNAARNLQVGAEMLGCTHDELAALALSAPPGADGLTLLPYFEGERTPDLPHARGAVIGATLSNFTRPHLARAIVEGTVASQVAMLDALDACGIRSRRLLVIGGAAKNAAVQRVLAELVDLPILVPSPDEYVAKGAAMQAAMALTGDFPAWPVEVDRIPGAPAAPHVRRQQHDAQVALGYVVPAPDGVAVPASV
ncbi:FGGY-family carbohydrate kinase [Microbacterium sp. 5K110]|uniref:FGGY-family carbohydrate kinase n=1 Tax=unclassified Microbacterium TaxID=2609290 RepID=UPI0010FE4AFA|nr:FGGY-family carbohydrate kinase [Microbacterium sp. 5K110]TLF29036.1 xylulose kinase [Microbacterium sp. 5K110]